MTWKISSQLSRSLHLQEVVDLARYPLLSPTSSAYKDLVTLHQSRLEENGVTTLPGLVTSQAKLFLPWILYHSSLSCLCVLAGLCDACVARCFCLTSCSTRRPCACMRRRDFLGGATRRSIEFVGDSITAATNVVRPEGATHSCGDAGYQSDWSLTYAARLCHRFGAACSTVAVGGKCV